MITHWDLLSKTRYSLRTCLEVILIPSFLVKPLTVISRRGHQLLSVLTWVVSETVSFLLLSSCSSSTCMLFACFSHINPLSPSLETNFTRLTSLTLHILHIHVLNINLKQRKMSGLYTEDLENSIALGLPSLDRDRQESLQQTILFGVDPETERMRKRRQITITFHCLCISSSPGLLLFLLMSLFFSFFMSDGILFPRVSRRTGISFLSLSLRTSFDH